jgi:hypothetical protein
MTDDRHIRICEDSAEEHLRTVSTLRIASRDHEEDAGLAAEHVEKNRRMASLLEEKGFGVEGDGSGGLQITC